MKQLRFSELVGKTIKKCLEDPMGETYFIVFEDNTYCAFKAVQRYESVELSDFPRVTPSDYADQLLIDLGLFTTEELEQARENKKAEQAKIDKERRQKLYESLKNEFDAL